ncbi:ankyrin repeat domain-containing protein [Aphanizomenon sp. CS-733/32]|uniref:ankyrin repeat domain-containing protein n=1 Tax=Aphanizomenon sp. CS-733/32 TaxID=3021715 RepID=UPI00232B7799|nr:ankyrin repeat domain-containing protein [Aphanizomenon sp. CS-733/32]MDB9310437.1 ankyrin repeat domain-containing protein [Aphanizomenon sp. CS-733/32]
METEQTAKILKQWFESWAKDDIEIVLDGLSENVIFYAPQNEHNKAIPYLGKRVGRQAVRSAFEIRAQTTKLLNYELLEFIVEGNKACIISRTQEICKQTEQIFEIEDAQFIVLDEAGKISSWSFYFDPNPEVAAFTANLDTELIQAVQNNQLSVVQSLLAIGANVNIRDKDAKGHLTPLMIATQQGNAEMVRLLLDSGADPYMLDSASGDSVLHQACQGGSVDVLQLLIEAGAFVNAVSPTGNHETPLHHALQHGHQACAEVLVYAGAELNLTEGIG